MIDEFVQQVFYPCMVCGCIAPTLGALLGMVHSSGWRLLLFDV